MLITCPGCQGSWVPGSAKAAVSEYCPSCRRMPALCSVAASAVAAQSVEAGSAVRWAPANKNIAVTAGAALLVLTLTLGAIGSASALRGKQAGVHETVATANTNPVLSFHQPQARAANGVAAPQSGALVERIAQPREVVEVMPAPIDVGQQANANVPAPPADPKIAAKACSGPGQPATTHGTTLEFAASPADALKQAAKERKLVFLLHISGNFEESGFT